MASYLAWWFHELMKDGMRTVHTAINGGAVDVG